MLVKFFKYHGTGNDFIMIDRRDLSFELPGQVAIAKLCHRRTGIGADGMIILQGNDELDFTMKYYNSDGYEGSMCGNGGRCAVAFAKMLGIIDHSARFESIDGNHYAEIESDDEIKLGIIPVSSVYFSGDHFELDTGSPHYVKFVGDPQEIDAVKEGYAIRNSPPYKEEGVNVNFVSHYEDGIFVRTYERGVEDETLSCGTGVVAAAICAAIQSGTDKSSYTIYTRGGKLKVSFERKGEQRFENIVLEGPVVYVYEGEVEI